VERAPRSDDVDLILELVNARSQKLWGESQATREGVEVFLSSPRLDPDADVRLVLDPDGALAGMSFVGNPGRPYADFPCPALSHPRYEEDAGHIDRLQSWTLHRAQELAMLASPDIRVVASAFVAAQDKVWRAALDRAGFRLVRVHNHMRIDLATPPAGAPWPPGIAVRTAVIEQDLDPVVACREEACRDQWGFVERPFDQVLAERREAIKAQGDKFDPTLWFLAVDGTEIVGLSLCDDRIVDDRTRGYVGTLGVRPAWRKRGIALALLHHTFAEFRRRGCAAVELDIDSQNLTGAVRMCERAGMRVVRQFVTYEKELRPGIDPATRELPA
jgi:ribosomal protein S18 acetylase RimI-like enzyme